MTKSKIRCAIYTRSLTDEGLDQRLNSLDAKREACTAYVAGQKHEGWVLDQGTQRRRRHLGRPALQRLLSNIDAGLIRMVVVYKVDRLTRSLADFTRLVERFGVPGSLSYPLPRPSTRPSPWGG